MLFDILREILKSAEFDYIGVRVYNQSELDSVVEFGRSHGYSEYDRNYVDFGYAVYCFLNLGDYDGGMIVANGTDESDCVIPFSVFKRFFLSDKSADIEGLI